MVRALRTRSERYMRCCTWVLAPLLVEVGKALEGAMNASWSFLE